MEKAEKRDFVPRFVPRFGLRYPTNRANIGTALGRLSWVDRVLHQQTMRAACVFSGAGFELVLHDERNDENLDNLFDKMRSAANDIRCGCLSKTVRDVQRKTPNPRQQLGFAGLGADRKSTQWVRVG